MKVVLDTDVVVAAMRSPKGASAELIRMARRQELTLAASVSLMMEYEAVCLRDEHWAAAGLDHRQVMTFLDAIAAFVNPVKVHFLWRPQLRDPADELVLEAAVNADADALISFNIRHFKVAVGKFNFRLALPGDSLRSIR